ncbi:hypothetical protein CY34DRAFT_800801 [Suillus luteus UH-Slu-Lm8-n1]|uniref:Uncharacterized protein n=1 Tax=Suillus luteus UH-Slu-Lm8-n1 TaxID=930992 RepID=A0A0D0BSV2_9AGAM|nr:hypothetical protein CY34DRAFT_800801 [Suillus luteus UH-Slu-Lm8-n1]
MFSNRWAVCNRVRLAERLGQIAASRGLILFYSTLGISSIRISSNKTAEIWRCRPAGPVTNSMRQTR